MTDKEKPKYPPKLPENPTGRQVAKYLLKGIEVRHKNQAADHAAAEAKKLEREKIAAAKALADRKAVRIANLRASAAESVAANLTPRKVAAFLFMPQFNHSFRGFGFAASLFVQAFAQALITVGLLPADHPARSLNGARGFKVFPLLEEARLNLLPLATVLDKNPSPQMAGIRAFATRQYIMFSSIIGLVVTGGLSILFGALRIVFFVSKAHAATSPSTSSTGLMVGFCPASGTGVTDFASSCLDNIFGTGSSSSGSTASLIGSGLGTMFRLYSNMVLVFAGIIVLWILISAVAETARTGVPFGKNFNSIWTPIRLVVALGLLVPLPSGMNSGQYIIISLAKWGSQQATNIWNGYAQNLVTSSTGGNQTISGLTSVSFNEARARENALKIMPIALCQAVQNQTCTDTGGQSCNIGPQVINTPTQPNAVANLSAAGGTPTSAQIGTVTATTRWIVKDPASPNNAATALAGYPDCGSVTVTLPATTSASNPTSGQSITSPIAQAAKTNAGNVLSGSAQNLVQLANDLQTVANHVEADAQTMVSPGNNESTVEYPPSQIYSDYNTAVTKYLSTQEQQTIPNNLKQYNGDLTTALTQMMQQNNGWISAPVWLLNIIMANGTFEDSVSNSGITITQPAENIASQFNGTAGTAGADNPATQWPQALFIWSKALENQAPLPPAQSGTYQSIISPLQNLTKNTSINPIASAGTYGRDLLLLGVFLIQPQPEQACYMGDTSKCLGKNPAMQNLLPGMSSLPYDWEQQLANNSSDPKNSEYHAALFPVGMMLISMGVMLIVLTMLLMLRFISGVLNWIMLIFEALLAEPMMALTLLNTGGEGFMPQQFSSNMVMLMGIILRPPLMILGTVLSIAAFGTIMQITNLIFAASLENMPLTSSGALLSLGIYGLIYALLAYTLANSAFKLIDLMPNWVMGWIGARMEQRADDVGQIQQQVAGYTSTLAYSSGRGGGVEKTPGVGGNQQQQNSTGGTTSVGGGGNPAVGATSTGGTIPTGKNSQNVPPHSKSPPHNNALIVIMPDRQSSYRGSLPATTIATV